MQNAAREGGISLYERIRAVAIGGC